MEPPVGGGGLSGSWFGTFDTSYVWFFDNTGGHYFSNDGGETWTYSSSTVSGTSLYWWNARTIALFVTPTTVYRYSAGWMVAGSTPGFFFSPLTGLVGALGTHQFWLVRDAIYYTPDAASSWTNSSPNGLNRHVGLIDMVTLGSEISAWATGVGDTVYRFHRTLTGVNEHPQPMPGEFSLSQNYPNPFNPRTTIRFSLSSRSQTLIKVFDLPGRELATLVDGSTEAGAHSVEWDASSLASGVYLYRIQAGDWIETRKMLLLK